MTEQLVGGSTKPQVYSVCLWEVRNQRHLVLTLKRRILSISVTFEFLRAHCDTLLDPRVALETSSSLNFDCIAVLNGLISGLRQTTG
ncbi:hypothetical protein ABKN59_003886 [Abortiporus biennis]